LTSAYKTIHIKSDPQIWI